MNSSVQYRVVVAMPVQTHSIAVILLRQFMCLPFKVPSIFRVAKAVLTFFSQRRAELHFCKSKHNKVYSFLNSMRSFDPARDFLIRGIVEETDPHVKCASMNLVIKQRGQTARWRNNRDTRERKQNEMASE